MRLPRISSASAVSMTSFWMLMVVMDLTSTSNTPDIYAFAPLRARKYFSAPLCRAISYSRGIAFASGAMM